MPGVSGDSGAETKLRREQEPEITAMRKAAKKSSEITLATIQEYMISSTEFSRFEPIKSAAQLPPDSQS
jgi:hypothetical protein